MPNVGDIAPYVIIAILAGFVLFILWAVPVRLWISAIAAGVPVDLASLIGMQFRRVDPRAIVELLIMAHKAGLKLRMSQLEAHYLAGGHVDRVVRALIAADKAGIPLSFEEASAIDLRGEDVYEMVRVGIEKAKSQEVCGRKERLMELDRCVSRRINMRKPARVGPE